MKSREQTFREAVEAYAPALQRLCRSYERDAALQEELRQEILLALWRALEGYRGEASLRTYVLRVAHNTAIKHVGRQVRRVPEAEEVEAPGPAVDPGSTLDRKRARERLLRAVGALPPLDRELVLLHLEGLPSKEIAEVTGLSPSNVTTRLSRLRRRLVAQVGE